MKPLSQWTQEDIDRLEQRLDNCLRYIILGSVTLCMVALIVAVLYHSIFRA